MEEREWAVGHSEAVGILWTKPEKRRREEKRKERKRIVKKNNNLILF